MRFGVYIVLGFIIFFFSCKKCKDYTHIGFAKITNEYFGNYKPGAYWIYLNRDSTKRDSIWIDNYKRWTVEDRLETCISTDNIIFDLHSQYLNYTTTKVTINTEDPGNEKTNSINAKDVVFFMLRDDSSSFYNLGLGITYPILYNYPLWNNNPNAIIPKVIQVNHIFFAADVGIIQYSPPFGNSSNDTFSLIKYYFP